MNDSIKKMLRITEKDLMITEVSYEDPSEEKDVGRRCCSLAYSSCL